jgi:sporulation protein YlmC with PRC-barrel domain
MGSHLRPERENTMKANWFLGAALAVLLSAGYLATAQDPAGGQQPPPPPAGNEKQPPPPPNENPPPPAQERRTDVQTQQGVQVQGQVQSERASARPMAFHRAKQILGTKVSIEGGLQIGTVEDIVFTDDGMVEYIVVQNEQKLVSVPWAAAKFNFDQRTAVVGISQERFQQIPTFTEAQWPRFQDPQYRVQTYSFYNVPVPAPRQGLTPGQERRVERRIDRGKRP